jgi:K(+)-stimulated pyrophosphate-energized sodium pump
MNPVIKFTTLFGLLAVELAHGMNTTMVDGRAVTALTSTFTTTLAAIFFAVSLVFVWRSFYAMRIRSHGS